MGFAVEWRISGFSSDNVFSSGFAAGARLWRAHSFCFPTPRRPNHPNLFLLGFSSKLISWHSRVKPGQRRAGRARARRQGRGRQGRAGRAEGRAGQGRAGQGRAGQGRAGQGRAGQGRAGQGRAGQGRAAGQGRGQDRGQAPGRGPGKTHFFFLYHRTAFRPFWGV